MSFYDWELGFKKKANEKDKSEKKEETYLLGIPKAKFKKFMENWKKQNLS